MILCEADLCITLLDLLSRSFVNALESKRVPFSKSDSEEVVNNIHWRIVEISVMMLIVFIVENQFIFTIIDSLYIQLERSSQHLPSITVHIGIF